MNDALRDKIARALGAGLEDHERPVFAGRQLATTQAEAIADAVLAVIDLDKVRAEAWDAGFDAGQAWESDMNSRVIPSADRQDNPYRPTGKEAEQ